MKCQPRGRQPFRPKLRQTTHVTHVAVGQEDAVGQAQAGRPAGVGAERRAQVVELSFHVGRSIDEPHLRRFDAPIDQRQAGGAAGLLRMVEGGGAPRATAPDVGQPGILQDAEDDGRDPAG